MAGITSGPNFRLLSGGDRLYAYSGVVVGDVSVPATVSLLKFENTGLRDMFLKLQPFFGQEIASGVADALGLLVTIDGVTVSDSQVRAWRRENTQIPPQKIELFIPKQSTLEVLSLNTSGNNTQERGCNALGWYL